MEEKIIRKDVSLPYLEQGMKILSTVYDGTGKALILKDTILTDKLLAKVKGHSIDEHSKYPVEIKIIIRNEREEKIDKIVKRIEKAFSACPQEQFYLYLKKKSIKTMEYLFNKNPELYE